MKRVLMPLTCVCALIASAEDLYYNGNGWDSSWNYSNKIWTNLTSTASVAFKSGDNVNFINPKIGTGTSSHICPGTTLNVGRMYFDVAGGKTHVLDSKKGGIITNMTSLVKDGDGTLKISGSSHFSSTNDFIINAGIFELASVYDANAYPAKSGLGRLDVPRTIYLQDSGKDAKTTLVMGTGHVFAPPTNKPAILIDATRAEIKLSGSNGVWPNFGDINLRDGSKMITRATSGSFGSYFNGTIRALRSETENRTMLSIVNETTAYGGPNFFGTAGEPVVFYVEEVTSDDPSVDDDMTDFKFACPIADCTNADFPTKASWIKTGPGTMSLASDNHGGQYYSGNGQYYSGNIEIREGVVKVWNAGSSMLGTGYADRTITLHTGTRMVLQETRVFNSNTTKALTPISTFVVSNAVLTQLDGDFQNYGNIKVFGDSKIEYGTGEYGYSNGLMGFGDLACFQLKNPMVFTNVSKDTGCQLSYTTANKTDGTAGYTDFRVMKCENGNTNGIADVTFKIMFKNCNYSGSQCGLKKSGTGVLRLAASSASTYTAETFVNEGGLLADTTLPATPVTVAAGGFIGGSGRLQGDLTVEEGGGFLIDATNRTAKLTVSGATTIPAKGLLAIYNYTNRIEEISKKLEPVSLPLKTLPDLSHINPGEWTVHLDGYPEKEWNNLKVTFDAETKTFGVKYASSGFVIIVR